MLSWTWNNITLSLWIRIDVKTLRTVGLRSTFESFPGFAAILVY